MQIYWELLLIFTTIFLGFFLLVSWILLFRHISDVKPKKLQELSNKKSVIKLPTIINLDIPVFLKYLVSDEKDDTPKIKVHKRILAIGLPLFIILDLYLLFFT